MEYTTAAQILIGQIERTVSSDNFEALQKELQSYLSDEKNLINTGNIYQAGEAVGINVELIDSE